MLKTGNGIVYANTTLSGLMYFNWFKEHSSDASTIIFYHSRFTEPHKKKKEGDLINLLGKKAWKEGSAGGIAIMTQIGEMSINICSELMYSEICPWDRLAQRVGRLSRFEEAKKGFCYIAIPTTDGELYPAPYGKLHDRKWQAGEAIINTQLRIEELLDTKEERQFSSEDFVREVNLLYPSPEKLSSYATANQQDYHKLIQDNWLIVPHTKSEEDEAKASNWKARDIMKQETFMTAPPEFYETKDEADKNAFPFANFESFRSYQLEHGVSCPNYLIKKANELGQLIRFPYTIGDDQEIHHVFIANCYNEDTGLAELGIEVNKKSGGKSTQINRIL
jgi:CRISPR-associated endonuclease/helicase Cas3